MIHENFETFRRHAEGQLREKGIPQFAIAWARHGWLMRCEYEAAQKENRAPADATALGAPCEPAQKAGVTVEV